MAHDEMIDVVVDTREQTPWAFSERARQFKAALPAGDYSVIGFETVIAIERKSLADFCQSLTHARDRFFREIKLLAGYPHAAVIVEADLAAILRGEIGMSKATPQSILGSAACIHADYKVPVIFAGNRPAAAWYAERLLFRYRNAQASKSKETSDGNATGCRGIVRGDGHDPQAVRGT